MLNTLIIEIPYGGLGDHLFHSHLPRIAKITGKYDKVYISNKSLYRHLDNKLIIWELNPYVDGFIDKPGKTCDLKNILSNIKTVSNLLDEIMCFYDLDDGTRMHEPEIYYNPIFIKEYNKIIFDPNYLSWVGKIDKEDMMWFLKKRNYSFEAIMKIRTEKVLYIPKPNDLFIETPTLQDFCDLIYSSKELFCLTSGTATLAAAIGKPAIVFYGANQGKGFRHSKMHQYILIPKNPFNRILRKFKKNIAR
ncbi:MAG: hypothetical protein A2X08_00580 [Bacteroidetes bacterium GWA2_32_17]|nr:MAG: hypothetical protein A2X08_00580 [Bacteroidetes bacterium GWA2_32_17]